MSEVGRVVGRRSETEVGGRKTEDGGHRSEVGDRDGDRDGGRRSETETETEATTPLPKSINRGERRIINQADL